MKTKRLFTILALLAAGAQVALAQDLTALQGWQIRPDYSFLKPGQTKALEVKLCQSNDIPGEDTLTALVYDCDDLTALINEAMVTDWSVNGVAGGNAQYGTIKATGPGTAQYKAPSKVPDSESIQVSAVVHPQNTSEKIIMVATITILGERPVYFGTVKINGGGKASPYSAMGSFVLQATGDNADEYTSVAGSLHIRFPSEECETFSGTVALNGSMTLWTDEVSRGMRNGNPYDIVFGSELFEISCHGIQVFIGSLMMIAPCNESIAESDPDYRTLWGQGTCEDMALSWRLTRQ